MRIVMFYHSLVSDWNHGNAHFLRGVVAELLSRGHDVAVYEPGDGWSLQNLLAEHGEAAVAKFYSAYPALRSIHYNPATLDLDLALADANLVLVHEWNDHDVVRRIGEHHARSADAYHLLFHDTHHRAVTDRNGMAAYDLTHYDGVLAFGGVIRDLYLSEGWTQRAWTWHEAADTQIFRPLWNDERDTINATSSSAASRIPHPASFDGDLVWIGNWGDDERTRELYEFLLQPVRALNLEACVYGVRYPDDAQRALADAGIKYRGWLPNFAVPAVFARFKVTVHVPRQPYVRALPGIPTIRLFEALACGIPLVSAPWEDAEHLFTPGKDFLVARDRAEMKRHLAALLADEEMRREITLHGVRTIFARHTCAHRVDELFDIYAELAGSDKEEQAELIA